MTSEISAASDPATSTAPQVTHQPDFEAMAQALGNGDTIPARTPWRAEHYNPLVTRSGARKLAASAVAPLVAAARGYESVDEEQSKDFAKRWNIGDGRSKRGSQFLSSFRDDGDILVMPWFRAGQSVRTIADFEKPSADSIQIRPENPRISEITNKVVKYEFLVGSDTVIDYHPAVTNTWKASVRRTMIAEGLLKGDSSLSAQLRHHVGDEELFLIDSDADRLSAMTRLAGLMERIPVDERVAILTIAGVGNWRSNEEWSLTNLREQEVLIAFDGDVATNWNVWNMAKDLFVFVENSRKATPMLISINEHPSATTALAINTHMGLDDFFHEVGDWSDLDQMIVSDLPERPERDRKDVEQENWRVTEDGCAVEEFAEIPDGNGDTKKAWLTRVQLGGRIAGFETHRSPTREEVSGAPFGTKVKEGLYPLFCTVDVQWKDMDTSKVQNVTVSGPAIILNYQPSDWVRHGAVIPKELLRHPDWPPRKGAEWLQAVKRNQSDQIEDHTVWTTMGWVAVENEDTQAFIAGDSIVAASESAKASTLAGVDELTLSGASGFGVDDVYTGVNFTDPTGEHNLADDIREVYNTYILSSPWETRQQAMVMLAAALRPALPLPTSVACYFVGAPQKGKSWSAKQVMSFWQEYPKMWDSLPGSAADTYASTENAVSKTPIWVADDFAPTSDRNAAAKMEGDIGNLIRAVNNNISKRRMNMDMTAKATPSPMALLILTAENEHSIQSIRERVVSVAFTGLNSENMAQAEYLSSKTTTASRVTAAVIRMFIERGSESGWPALVKGLIATRDNAILEAKDVLATLSIAVSDSSRPAEITGDLSMGLTAFAELAALMGLDDIADAFSWEPDSGCHLIAEQVSYGHMNKADMSPGQVLLDSIRNVLTSGKGHIARMDRSGVPPLDGEENELENSLLGWVRDGQENWRPRGNTLGHYAETVDKATGITHEVIYLSRDDSFNEAQKAYPKRIQFGVDPTTTWKNVWDLNLVHPAFVNKRPKSGVVVQWRSATMRPYGVPVSLAGLFPNKSSESEEDEGDANG